MADGLQRPEPPANTGRWQNAPRPRGAAAHPQLTGEEMQQLKWLLGGLLTLLSVSTVLYMETDALTLMVITALAVGAAVVWPTWPARIPRLMHRLSFSFVAGFFTLDLWITGELLPAIVRLDLLLLLYRGISYRQRRDDLQVIVLGLFLIVLGGVLSVSLTFVAQILAFTAGALAFLLVITLAGAEEDATGGKANRLAKGVDAVAPAWATHVRWARLLSRVKQVTNWRVVTLGVGLFAGLVAVSALLFVAIPRVQLENSFFLDRFITKKTLTGFSDTIRFGEVTDITQDNSVALSVDVSDRSQIPASPYWRMLVLDDYRDGTFRLSPGLRGAALGRERVGVMVHGGTRDPRVADAVWTFYFEAGVSRFLPLLGRFQLLRFREPQNFRFAPGIGVLELRSEPATMLAYRVQGVANSAVLADQEFARRWREQAANPRAANALMLRLGVGEPDQVTLQRVLAEIVAAPEAGHEGGGTAPAMGVSEFVRRVNAWLGRRHAYSLSPRIPAGEGDPLVRWLTSTEGGHCELFAGSLVLLARSAGIPARVVTGFRGGSWNGYSNNFTLRNSDAHAWCEVFDASAGAWLRADPTPGSSAAEDEQNRGEESLARMMDRSWTARLDSLRVFWYRRIVNFDQQSQVDTFDAVKSAAAQSSRALREALARWTAEMRAWFGAPWTGGRTTTVLMVVVATAGAAWALWVFGGAGVFRWRFSARRKRGDAVRREAGRWLVKLAGVGAVDDRGERELHEQLQRLRYGARETWPEPVGVFRRARSAWRVARRHTTRS